MAIQGGTSIHTVGIVGGGHAGLQLFNLFLRSGQTRTVFVVDSRPDAPAIMAARDAGVATYTQVDLAIKSSNVNYIFEVTGRDEVADLIRTVIAGTDTRLVPHDVAHVVLAVTEEDRQRTRSEVTGEITYIKHEITRSLDGSHNVVGQINQIMGSLQMLALNASIEAAKVGVHGKGFMVVADHMSKSVESVRKMTREIESMNGNIQVVAEKIDAALERMK